MRAIVVLILLFLATPSWAGTFAIDVSKLSQTVNKTSNKTIKVVVWIWPKSTTISQATLTVVGGKSQEENSGTGTTYNLAGPGVTLVTHVPEINKQVRGSYSSPYETTNATITIPPGATSTYFTITPINNKCPSLDQVLKIYLSNPSAGNKVIANNLIFIKIFDDTIPLWNGVRNIVSVLDPNLNWDSKAPFNRSISKAAKGDGVTDDTAAIQEVVDWVYAHGGGVVYFPGAHTATATTAIVRPINRFKPSSGLDSMPWELSLRGAE